MHTEKPMPLPLFIQQEHVQALLGCSRATAYRKIKEAQKALKQLEAPLTVVDFCQYAHLDIDTAFLTILELSKKTSCPRQI